ncbi:hypothetical protein HK101_007677 [Irineochytrium annulatum]|nr:hypothetical protein HK101_007677 [Irineochytrium annulatum]
MPGSLLGSPFSGDSAIDVRLTKGGIPPSTSPLTTRRTNPGPPLHLLDLPYETLMHVALFLHPHVVRHLPLLSKRANARLPFRDVSFARRHLKFWGCGHASIEWVTMPRCYRVYLLAEMGLTNDTMKLLHYGHKPYDVLNFQATSAPRPHINPAPIATALVEAATYHNLDPSADAFFAFQWCAATDSIGPFMTLVSLHGADFFAMYHSLFVASAAGSVEVLNMVLAMNAIDPGIEEDSALRIACYNGHAPVVETLLRTGLVDPTCQKNTPLQVACKEGHAGVVLALLNSMAVDVSCADHICLRTASARGHLEVVRLLLNTGMSDPSANDHDALISASREGHLDIVLELLQTQMTDPAARNSEAFRLACRRGHEAIASVLLNTGMINASASDSEALRTASANGHVACVRLVIAAGAGVVDCRAKDQECLTVACGNGHMACVAELLGWDVVDPCWSRNAALRAAVTNSRADVVAALMADGRVDPLAPTALENASDDADDDDDDDDGDDEVDEQYKYAAITIAKPRIIPILARAKPHPPRLVFKQLARQKRSKPEQVQGAVQELAEAWREMATLDDAEAVMLALEAGYVDVAEAIVVDSGRWVVVEENITKAIEHVQKKKEGKEAAEKHERAKEKEKEKEAAGNPVEEEATIEAFVKEFAEKLKLKQAYSALPAKPDATAADLAASERAAPIAAYAEPFSASPVNPDLITADLEAPNPVIPSRRESTASREDRPPASELAHVASRILLAASERGSTPILRSLLTKTPLRINVNDNHVWLQACSHGHVGCVELLLELGADPTTDDCIGLREASRFGHLGVVDALLKDGRVNPAVWDNEAAELALENEHIEVVRRLMETGRLPITWTIRVGHLHDICEQEVQKAMARLENEVVAGTVTLSGDDTAPVLLLACQMGFFSCAAVMLKSKEVREGPGKMALIQCLQDGLAEAVTLLIAADVTLEDHEVRKAFVVACGEGHVDAVKAALKSGPSDGYWLIIGAATSDDTWSTGLLAAAIWGHAAVVEALLAQQMPTNITKSMLEEWVERRARALWSAYLMAVRCNNVGVLEKMIGSVDPASAQNEALVTACVHRHKDVVAHLLGLDGVDPAARDNEPIKVAGFSDCQEIVDLLVATGKVDPSARMCMFGDVFGEGLEGVFD